MGQFEHRLFWSVPKYIVKLTTDDHYYKTEGGEQAQIRPRALKKEGPEEQYGVQNPHAMTKRFPPTLVLNAPAAKDKTAQSGTRMHHRVSNALRPLSSGGGPTGSNIFGWLFALS